jgi:acyl-CoA reductase-like NAD-dependent aldehyde dehydrogenase
MDVVNPATEDVCASVASADASDLDAAVTAARAALNGLDVDYVEVAELDGQRILAAAVRVGKTRLIDNIVLEGEPT